MTLWNEQERKHRQLIMVSFPEIYRRSISVILRRRRCDWWSKCSLWVTIRERGDQNKDKEQRSEQRSGQKSEQRSETKIRTKIGNKIWFTMVFRKDPCGFFCILMTYGKTISCILTTYYFGLIVIVLSIHDHVPLQSRTKTMKYSFAGAVL